LITAPAGFGKTTLVADWIENSQAIRPDMQFAWLSLDEDDNDVHRFFSYVAASVEKLEGVGQSIQAQLQALQPAPTKSLATALLNDSTAVSSPFALILDDYHVVNTRAIHEAVAFLLDHSPPQMIVVITSRVDPMLPLSRLRARGQMIEVRTDDLRFSADEAASFLRQGMGLTLSAEDVNALEARTEGWIAGLQMAALSMQGLEASDEIADFVTAFTGSHRYILDYLADEVLQQRPPGTREFLLQTSILDQLSGPLCDAVTGDQNGQAQLEQLEKANLFIAPMDNERRWYRYHALFADLLRHRLRRFYPDLAPVLYQRACTWYEERKQVETALHYALAGGDQRRAALLLDEVALELVNRAETAKILALVNRVPEELRSDYPRLCLGQAWAFIFSRQLDRVEPALALAEAHLERPDTLPVDLPAEMLSAMAVTIRAYLATWQQRYLEAIDLSVKAVKALEAQQVPHAQNLQGAAVLNLGITYKWLGNMVAAEEALVKATALNRKTKRIFAMAASVSHLMSVRIMQGQLGAAMKLGEQGQAWLEQHETVMFSQNLPAEGEIGLIMVTLCYERNELSAASAYLKRMQELYVLPTFWIRIILNDHLFYLHQALGERDIAIEYHQRIERIVANRDFSRIGLVRAQSARRALLLWRLLPDSDTMLGEAIQWANAAGIQPQDTFSYAQEKEYATLAHVLVDQNKADSALKLIESLCQAAEKTGRDGDLIGYCILHALALQSLGKREEAMEPMRQAIILAEPASYIRSFVDEGAPIVALLNQAASRGIAPRYVSRILAALPESLASKTAVRQPLVDPLSERELEVLRLLATGQSGPKIAEQLYVSVNTIKTHIRNIYGKLGVNSREGAIGRAQTLGLIA
jgi:LuxR family maltose regulon positive regulatory protein